MREILVNTLNITFQVAYNHPRDTVYRPANFIKSFQPCRREKVTDSYLLNLFRKYYFTRILTSIRISTLRSY